MTQYPIFSQIPRYNLPATTPFTRQTATSMLERLEELYQFVVDIQAIVVQRDEIYSRILDDANIALTTAIEAVLDLQGRVEADAEKVFSGLAQVDAALTALAAYQEATNQRLDGLDAAMEQFNADMEDLAARVAELERQSRRHVEKDHLFIDVTDHGAVGDGATDCTLQIQAAIDLAGPGGKVYLPKGRYVIRNTLTIPASATLEGVGRDRDLGVMDGTTIEWKGGGTSAVKLSTGAMVKHLGIWNRSDIAGSIGINALNVSGFETEDVMIREFDKGLIAEQVWYARCEQTDILFCRIGMDITYCYNFDIQSSRFASRQMNADRTAITGAPGECINLNDKCMVKCYSVAFEGYSTAVRFNKGTSSISAINCYFEAPNNQTNAVAFRAREGSVLNNMAVIGCDIYITNHQAFFYVATACNEKIVSIGNRVVGGNDTSECKYFGVEVNGGPMRLVAMGDSINRATKCDYIPERNYIPGGSLVHVPYGGSQVTEGLYSTGSTWLGSRTIFAPQDSLPSGMSAVLEGLVVYDKTRKALVLFDGTGWKRVDGSDL